MAKQQILPRPASAVACVVLTLVMGLGAGIAPRLALAEPDTAPASPEQESPDIPTVPESAVPEAGTEDGQQPSKKSGSTTEDELFDPGQAAYEEALQRYGRFDRFERTHGTVRDAFKSIVQPNRSSVATIYRDKEQLALGTVVSELGETLTKASELGDFRDVEVEFADGSRVPVRVRGVHQESDLALLMPAEEGTFRVTPIRWALSDPMVGSWVITPEDKELPLSVGVVSHEPRRIRAADAVLGVQMDQAFEGEGVRLDKIFPQSGAEAAGLAVNDIVTVIDGKAVKGPADLVRAVRGRTVGDIVLVEVRRGSETLLFSVPLKERTAVPFDGNDRSLRQNTMGGEISTRRGGFPAALQHDSVLRPDQVGGPLLNLDGEAVGINIARAGRVETYALAANYVAGLLSDLRDGKFDPAIAVKKRLTDLDNALVKLREKETELATSLEQKKEKSDTFASDLKAKTDAVAEAQKVLDEAKKAQEEAAKLAKQAEAALAQTRKEIERIEQERKLAESQLADK